MKLLVLMILPLAIGCSSIQQDSTIVTDGMHRKLPSAEIKTVLWGNDGEVANAATVWLQEMGLTVIDRAQLHRMLNKKELPVQHVTDHVLFSASAILGAEQIIYIATGDYSVALRGVELKTQDIMWMGTAKFINPSGAMTPQREVALARHALATAFGCRPPGKYDIRSEPMCKKQKDN